jgi:hypothetical protein
LAWHYFSRTPLASADKYDMLRVSQEKKGLIMSADGTYNGYANYQTWNVCLWIANDEMLYDLAKQCGSYAHFKILMREVFERDDIRFETKDGVAWSDSGINLTELQEFWSENFLKMAA